MNEYKHAERGNVWNVRDYGLVEFLDASNGPPHPKNAEVRAARRFRGDTEWPTEWTGGTREEARTRRSWPEGVARLATINLDGAELPKARTRKRVRVWGDDGDEFSRDRLDAGYLDCWQSRRRQTTETANAGFVRLTVEVSASAKKGADSLIWSGIATAKLADELETAGYRVEIAVILSSRNINGSNYRTVDTVHLKSAEDPLNIDAVLFAVAHPLFLRYHSFTAIMRRPVRVKNNLGYPADTPQGLRGDIHVAKVFTKQDAERVVRAELEKRS